MKPKINVVAKSQQKTGYLLMRSGPLFLLAFVYSFWVSEPHYLVAFDQAVAMDHYEAVLGGRWWFFAAFFFCVAGALYSFRKSGKRQH